MPVFLYEGKSLDGSTVKGMIDLETQDDVKEIVHQLIKIEDKLVL